MPYPEPNYPSRIWNGLSDNPNRVDNNSNLNPDSNDWNRISSEVISMQQNMGAGVLLPVVKTSGPLFVVDRDKNRWPLTTSAVVLVDATSGAVLIELPKASTFMGKTLVVKKIDPSRNEVTLTGHIDGKTNKNITTQYMSLTIVCDGTSWYII